MNLAKQRSLKKKLKVQMRLTQEMARRTTKDLKKIVLWNCVSVKFVWRGLVVRVVGGKTVPINVSSACFSILFVSTFPRAIEPDTSLER